MRASGKCVPNQRLGLSENSSQRIRRLPKGQRITNRGVNPLGLSARLTRAWLGELLRAIVRGD
jgi:hypothetical protein